MYSQESPGKVSYNTSLETLSVKRVQVNRNVVNVYPNSRVSKTFENSRSVIIGICVVQTDYIKMVRVEKIMSDF